MKLKSLSDTESFIYSFVACSCYLVKLIYLNITLNEKEINEWIKTLLTQIK